MKNIMRLFHVMLHQWLVLLRMNAQSPTPGLTNPNPNL